MLGGESRGIERLFELEFAGKRILCIDLAGLHLKELRFLTALSLLCVATAQAQDASRVPVAPVPSSRQLAWQSLEFSAFVHFGINTFTDREWGYGDESPDPCNPPDFNADRIVRVFHDAGMQSVS